MQRVLDWVGLKACQARAGAHQCAGNVIKDLAMARNDGSWRQRFNQVQRGGHLPEGVLALELRKHNAKAVFPQCIAGDQQAQIGLKKHHRMRIVPRRGVDLPPTATQLSHSARFQYAIRAKARAELPGWLVGERHRVPVAHLRQLPWRNDGLRAGPARLQRGIATAVVAVQMRVENASQGAIAQRPLHQRHRFCRIGVVARIHYGHVARAGEKDVVRRKPAALKYGDFSRKRL